MSRAEAVSVPANLAGLPGLDRVDYADALSAESPVRSTPEQWARLCVQSASPAVRTFLAGVFTTISGRVVRTASGDRLLGWEFQEKGPERAVLGLQSPIGLTARLVFLSQPGEVLMATLIRYDRGTGRLVWAALAPIHRRIARYILEQATQRAAAEPEVT